MDNTHVRGLATRRRASFVAVSATDFARAGVTVASVRSSAAGNDQSLWLTTDTASICGPVDISTPCENRLVNSCVIVGKREYPNILAVQTLLVRNLKCYCIHYESLLRKLSSAKLLESRFDHACAKDKPATDTVVLTAYLGKADTKYHGCVKASLSNTIFCQRSKGPTSPTSLLPDHLVAQRLLWLFFLTHHVTRLSESNESIRCLLLDFSKAFDTVSHVIVIKKLKVLNLPPAIYNWIMNFLTDRTQTVVINGKMSNRLAITRSIVQGSGLGPFFVYSVHSWFGALSIIILLCKYRNTPMTRACCLPSIAIYRFKMSMYTSRFGPLKMDLC